MSSNPLMKDYEWDLIIMIIIKWQFVRRRNMSIKSLQNTTTYCWLALPEAGCWVTVQGCVCRLYGDLNNGLVAQFQWCKCALECLVHETCYTNRRLYLFSLPLVCTSLILLLLLLAVDGVGGDLVTPQRKCVVWFPPVITNNFFYSEMKHN